MPSGVYPRDPTKPPPPKGRHKGRANKKAKLGSLEPAIAELFEDMYWRVGVDPQTPETRSRIEKIKAKRTPHES